MKCFWFSILAVPCIMVDCRIQMMHDNQSAVQDIKQGVQLISFEFGTSVSDYYFF